MNTLIILAFIGFLLLRKTSQASPPLLNKPAPAPTIPLPLLDESTVFRINRYTGFINDVVNQLGIDPNLLRALIYVKSGGDERAQYISPDGEYGYGLTQITCGRARMMPQPAASTSIVDKIVNSADCPKLIKPENSIWYGAAYLRAVYQGDWVDALARYNSPSNMVILNADAFERARETLLIAEAFRGKV